jgi:GT2 family glycosyltransferase
MGVGAFDRAFHYCITEDVDLGWRLWLLGRRVVVCGEPIVYHLIGGTTKKQFEGISPRMGPSESWQWRHNVRTLDQELRTQETCWSALKGGSQAGGFGIGSV